MSVPAMIAASMDAEWLRGHDVGAQKVENRKYLMVRESRSRCFRDDESGKLGRIFKVETRDGIFEVAVRQWPTTAIENFSSPAYEPEVPTDGEVLGVIARVFLASLPREMPPVRGFSGEGGRA